eukprot:TRINITY_DN8433_c0_g1_i1.p1 TRINITY_DN8433_c0_g1~~TRINITY_DN8433_c0_g1_i1.p1  ORF type:complete len:250 (-),score=28.77 TRINITY_DN8433_c0_g1_i1:19-768(-)
MKFAWRALQAIGLMAITGLIYMVTYMQLPEVRALCDDQTKLAVSTALQAKTEELDKIRQELDVQTDELNKMREERDALLMWTVKDHLPLSPLRVVPEIVLNPTNMENCAKSRFRPGIDKFDVVYGWVNMSQAGYVAFPPNLKERVRKTKKVGINRPPFSEIIFSLRSLVKNEMLPHIGNIFILYDDARHGPPTFVNRSSPAASRIRFVPHSELVGGTPFIDRVRSYPVVAAYMHHILSLIHISEPTRPY